MKATKKIVGAACALVAAVALSAGSTFAWFATNNAVSATGLQMTVNTASSYLLIGNSTQNTPSKIREANGGDQRSVAFTSSTKELAPVAHEDSMTATSIEYKNLTGENEVSLWYTQIADSASSSVDTVEPVKTKVDLTAYVQTDTIHLTVKAGSGASAPVHCNGVTVLKPEDDTNTKHTVQAVSVILVCGNNLVEYKSEDGSTWTAVGNTKLTESVTDPTTDLETDVTKVKVYVYYDGTDSTVYTNNNANLVGATVSISLTAQTT